MKKTITRLLTLLAFCFSLLLCFLLNPSLIYANSTEYRNVTIYHNGELNPDLKSVIDLSLNTIEGARIYTADSKHELCLNKGLYPRVVRTVLGDDVFTAFSNKVVVLGAPSEKFNRFVKWEKTLKYSQFLSHAFMHNLQFKHHGFWRANPLGGHPDWKWEGYVEYEVLGDQVTLKELVDYINNSNTNDYDWIDLGNDEGTLKLHVKYLALVKYCFEVLEWDYNQLMKSRVEEQALMEDILSYD